MANNQGTLITDTIRPFSDQDTFPVAYSNEIQGGLKSVATLTDRNIIPAERLQQGTLVFVVETGFFYKYINTSWVQLSKSDIQLNNVDNTSDLNKPISIATKNELDQKVSYLEYVNGAKSLGPYNASTNVPALTATPDPALYDGDYYDITGSGILNFSGINFNAGTVSNIGDRLKKKGNQWYLIASPQNTSKIQSWTSSEYPIGSQVNYLGQDYVNINSIALSNQIPGIDPVWFVRLYKFNNDIEITMKLRKLISLISDTDFAISDDKGYLLFKVTSSEGVCTHRIKLFSDDGSISFRDSNNFEGLNIAKNGNLSINGLKLKSNDGFVYISDVNGNICLEINKEGFFSFIQNPENFLINYNRAFNSKDFLVNFPSFIFDIESSTRFGREYATSVYPESFVGQNVKVKLNGNKKVILKKPKPTWSDDSLQSSLISSNYTLKIGGNGYIEKTFSFDVKKANRKNAQNKSIKVLAIGDSLTEANCSYPDGTRQGWSWISCLKEISMKDNIDINNINIINIGTKNNEGGTLNYLGQNQTIRSFAEGRSGWSMYGYANYPLYVRVDGAATPADGQNFMGYKGMYYLCGLATKTPNFNGSTPGQTWTDCPNIDNSNNYQNLLLDICGTPVGRYKPNYCEILWNALKVYSDFPGTGQYIQSTSDSLMDNYLFNSTNGKFIKPDNPFYDYDKAKNYTSNSPTYEIAFSIQKYLERYKTLSDDGLTRLVVGNTAGSYVTNVSSYDVCTPTHIIVGLGTNDQWLNPENSALIGIKLLNSCKFNNTVNVGWWIKRFAGVLDNKDWVEKGLLLEGISERYFNINKQYQSLIGNLDINRRLNYIPAYYTHCITSSVNSFQAEDADSNFKNKLTISSDDSIHCDIFGHYTIGHQALSWIYWTLS